MELSDLERIKNYETENDLVEILQKIDDTIVFRGYNKEQVLCLVKEIIKIDLLAVKYETREEILHLLCDAISYHGIHNCVNWARIVDIKDKLEDDLKEYIEEFIEKKEYVEEFIEKYSRFGISIIKQGEKFFLQYDSGEIVSKVKTIEISEREAKELKALENEHSVHDYMINNLNDRI